MVYKCDITELKTIVGKHYETKTPIFVYGGYGVGKSSAIKQIGQELAVKEKRQFMLWDETTEEQKKKIEAKPESYFVLFDERLSQNDISDLKGIPAMFNNNESVEWKIPRWLNLTTNKKLNGIIFFDELNLASLSVQASCYKIINDRTLSDKKISEGMFIMGAGNRIQDSSNVFPIPAPLRDRMSEVELTFNDNCWFDWAEKQSFDTRIISFLKYKPSYCNKVEESKESKSATPRGWERCNNQIKGLELNQIEPLISVAVGEVMGTEMVSFIKLSDQVDISKILNKPSEVKKLDESSLKYSVCSAISEKYSKNRKLLHKIIDVANELEIEFGMLLLRLCKSIDTAHFTKEGIKHKNFMKIASNYTDIMSS